MTVPQKYRGKGEPSVATYDFFDLATGKGIKTFYAAGASGAFILTTEAIYSSFGDEGHIIQTAELDKDFDITFERPFEIEGDTLVTVPFAIERTAGSGLVSANLIVNLNHVPDGGAETLLASGSILNSATLDAAGTDAQPIIATFRFDIARTVIGVGDILRLTLLSKNMSGGRHTVMWDPANRTTNARFDTFTDTGWDTVQTTVKVPFILHQI